MELRLEARRLSVAEARRWVVDRAREHHLDDDKVHVVQLLTSELVANAMMYGPADGEVVVRTERVDGHFGVLVRDENPEPPVVRDTPPDVPGGQGLRLVDRLATAWGVELDVPGAPGKVVWFRVAV